MKGGIRRRTVAAGGLLALIVGATFAALLVTIDDLHDAADRAQRSEEVLTRAYKTEQLVIDMETGLRGFLITGDERFLAPWEAARRAFPDQASKLVRLAAAGNGQGDRARQIAAAGTAYITEYSIPTVEAARRDLAAVRTVAVTDEGKQRVDALRRQFDDFIAAERKLAISRQDSAGEAARRAIVAGSAGVAGSVVLVIVFTAYLARVIVRPVRHAAGMAGRLAGGDLTARLPETAPGEIGTLERAFNTMAGSLEASSEYLGLLLQEQAALRRVATLVAKGASPTAVFAAVAEEVGRLLGAPSTRLFRYEVDGTATVVSAWSEATLDIPVGTRLSLDGENVAASVLRTGRPARIDSCEAAPDEIAAYLREMGIRSAVGAPIEVQDRLWGVMIADSTDPAPLPAATETRLAQFTELVATAIANAQSRAELAASRARVVAAADETRRRLERDLHDGTQQRIVALTLQLRMAEAGVPADLPELKAQLQAVGRGLSNTVEELREFSRGLHPAVLSRGGLGPALRTLARRSAVPVRVDVPDDGRLPEPVEVAAYYVVSEAITNATKHAGASVIDVALTVDEGVLRLSVRDDGVGGADPGRGSGLVGLKDRVESVGGTILILSPVGEGTCIEARMPVEDPAVATAG